MLIDFAKDLLGFLLVFPEILFCGYLFEFFDFFQTFIDVKDTPVTVLCGDVSGAGVLFRVQTSFNLLLIG